MSSAAAWRRRLASNLKRHRAGSGLTHNELGAKLGVTLWTSMRWCAGSLVPSLAQLMVLARIYGTSASQLLGEK